jgi:hypothetical protein
MSHNASMSQTTVSQSSASALEDQGLPANAELHLGEDGFEGDFGSVADRLMNNIFADVERMLERGVDLTDEPEVAAIPTPPEPLWSAPDDLATVPTAKLSPRPSLLEQAETPEELADLAALMAEVSEETAPTKPTRSFDRLLLSLILASLVATGGLWFYFRSRLQPVASVEVASPSADQIQQQKNQEFLRYVGRSLDRIERDGKAQREAATIAAAGASPSPASSPTTVLERVYIPIYQTPPAAVLPNPAVLPIAPPALAPQTAPQTAPSAVSPAAPSAPNIAAASAKHVLLGVLELGDRSAALFEIDGTPERVQMGEAIGNSGWSLVSISNQEAIVRRNGEVRSIYVGQQF